ncbi:DUF4143 domain-containing protein [Thalassobacterium maritimum]|uniref:DUF4143 domain-containing protein n=1 Tax=Thalassobacterium maritimum TaxID=3041265 RepID=UPI0031F308A9
MGGLFENLVVLEALKSRTHRGHDPSLYFFRDHNGREVDLLYPDGNQVIPIEIKSAQTFDASFAKGVHYFQKLSNSDHRGWIIYAGDSEFVTDQYEVSNFKSAFDV